MTAPLETLNVLDFTSLLPGPWATMMLADLGANVVRVEAPGRVDLTRISPPYDGDVSVWHALLNRNKRSVTINLKAAGAVAVVQELVRRFDIVIEGFRPGVMDRLGVGYEALRAVNPRLIYCALTGYGQDGPYRDRAGHDINYLALAGISHVTGRQEQGPAPLGVQLADVGAGAYNAVTAILSAAIQRGVSGVGQFVDVSLFDGAVAWNSIPAAYWLAGGEAPGPETMWLNGASYYDYYRTADDRWLAVGSLEPKFALGLCVAVGQPDLANRLATLDPAEQGAAKAELAALIAARPLAAWQAIFAKIDVCVEPVLTVPEALDHPQAQARGLVIDVPRGAGRTQRQVRHPNRFSAAELAYRHAGGPAGAHSEEILREAGFDADAIDALRNNGILG
jgi:crotonobetainyl-CoA:carnitine CoA-transferase CaiB-like acyl-CoA transferase